MTLLQINIGMPYFEQDVSLKLIINTMGSYDQETKIRPRSIQTENGEPIGRLTRTTPPVSHCNLVWGCNIV